MQETKVLVVGVGRIGAVTAVGMAHLLHSVTAVDKDERRISELSSGSLRESEPGLRSALKSALRIRRLRFATDADEAGHDVAFLCVDTPPGAGGSPDLSQVFEAARYAATRLRSRGILVTRSTVPPGTGDRLRHALSSVGRRDIQVAHVPEFLREGRAWEDFREPDRIVIGANNAAVTQRVRDLFEGVVALVIETDGVTAELAKYAANAYLATSISFANEMWDLSQQIGADAPLLFDILKADRRVGPNAYLTPGLGFGGHCLPKDTAALEYVGAIHGVAMRQLTATMAVNHHRVPSTLAWLRTALDGLADRRIAVAGLAFKPSTDDTRESPGLKLADALGAEGALVVGYDPLSSAVAGLAKLDSLAAAADGADALVLTHPGPWIAEVSPAALASLMRTRVVYDASGAAPGLDWESHGFVTNLPCLRRSRPSSEKANR